MTRPAGIAYRLRWLILIAGLVCVAAGVWWLIWPESLGGVWGISEEPVPTTIFLGVILLAQGFFLAPARNWTLHLSLKRRSMKGAIVTGAAAAALLSAGFVAALLEIPDWWHGLGSLDWGEYWPWYVLAGLWAFWAVVIYRYCHNRRDSDRYSLLSAITTRLVAATILEMLTAAPVQAFVKDRHNCECGRGSFMGLICGIPVMFWVFGPGIILLFMRPRYLRRKAMPICFDCGYDLRGSIPAGSTSCPECGAAIPAADDSEGLPNLEA